MTFKFSKDKFWLEPPSENLKKQLEDELRLSGTNLKSHAWYHGPVPWEVCTYTHPHTALTQMLICFELCSFLRNAYLSKNTTQLLVILSHFLNLIFV